MQFILKTVIKYLTFGMTRSDLAKSAMASCSLLDRLVAKFSRYIDRAASTHPPPTTTVLLSRIR
jgi:hypothetical protein